MRDRSSIVSVCLALCLLSYLGSIGTPAGAADQSRVALVIGNAKYQHGGKLINSVNDAELIARVLASTGFTVTKVTNATRQQMQTEMLSFSRTIRALGTVGLFYFAGHGLQVNGLNYLVPVDADIQSEDEIAVATVSVDEFLQALDPMGGRDGRFNIVVLDACRNNPFARGWRSASRGLAPIGAPSGTLIAFATAPGDVASDGADGNSPYAKGLSQAIVRKGVPVEETFKLAREHVLAATASNSRPQTPWEQSSLTGSFYFVPGATAKNVTSSDPELDVELAFWRSVEASQRPEDYQFYLRSYPKGKFAPLARSRLAETSVTAAQGSRKAEGTGRRELIDPSTLPDSPGDHPVEHGVVSGGNSDDVRPLIEP